MTIARSDITPHASAAEAQQPLASAPAAAPAPSAKPVPALSTTAQMGVDLKATFSKELTQLPETSQTLAEQVINLINKEDTFVDGLTIQNRSSRAHYGPCHTDHGFISPVDESFPDYNASSIEGSNLVAAKGPRSLEDVAQLLKSSVFNDKKPVAVIVALGTDAAPPEYLKKKSQSVKSYYPEDNMSLGSFDFVGYFLKDEKYKYKDEKEQPSYEYTLNDIITKSTGTSYFRVQVIKKVKYSGNTESLSHDGYPGITTYSHHGSSLPIWLGYSKLNVSNESENQFFNFPYFSHQSAAASAGKNMEKQKAAPVKSLSVISIPIVDMKTIDLAHDYNGNMKHLIYKIYEISLKEPVLIHCAAGIGRTGHLVLMLEIMKHYEKIFSSQKPELIAKEIYTVLSRIRKNRPALVANKEQFIEAIRNAEIMHHYILKQEKKQTKANASNADKGSMLSHTHSGPISAPGFKKLT